MLFFQLDDDLEDYYDYVDDDDKNDYGSSVTTEAISKPIQITTADEITCKPSNEVTTAEIPITTTEAPIQNRLHLKTSLFQS